jgi:hypothetical protein
MVLDNDIHQGLAETVRVPGAGGVLKARQCGLRSERFSIDGVPTQKQLVDGILGKPSGVVGVGISTGDPEHALTNQLVETMDDLAGLALIAQATRKTLGQPKPLVRRAEKDSSAVGTGVRFIELRNDGLAEQIREYNRVLRGRVHQAKASCVRKDALASAFYHMEAFVLSSFVNYPG